jgi:hypothetical protein
VAAAATAPQKQVDSSPRTLQNYTLVFYVARFDSEQRLKRVVARVVAMA